VSVWQEEKRSVFSTSGDGKSVKFDRCLNEAQGKLQQTRQKSRQKSTDKKLIQNQGLNTSTRIKLQFKAFHHKAE
jgi:hypothetical protein